MRYTKNAHQGKGGINMYKSTDKYGFAIGKQIKKVFTESFLYRDGEYDEYTYEALSLRRIDQPLYLLY